VHRDEHDRENAAVRSLPPGRSQYGRTPVHPPAISAALTANFRTYATVATLEQAALLDRAGQFREVAATVGGGPPGVDRRHSLPVLVCDRLSLVVCVVGARPEVGAGTDDGTESEGADAVACGLGALGDGVGHLLPSSRVRKPPPSTRSSARTRRRRVVRGDEAKPSRR